MSERDRKRYAADPEKERTRVKRYNEAHPEKQRERNRRYYVANKEAQKARARQQYANLTAERRREYERNRTPRPGQNRQWDQKNPGRRNFLQRRRRTPTVISTERNRRRSFLLQSPGRGVDAVQWKEVAESYCGLCAYCNSRGKITMDHIEPLKTGGAHDIENIAPACRYCNPSKSDTPLLVWLARRAA